MEKVKLEVAPLEKIENPIEVTEKMANFIDWCYGIGEEKIREMVRGRLAELKQFSEENARNIKDQDGFVWDPILEPNDGVDQWKHGGDCNLCRKNRYCQTQCRSNRLMKAIIHPFLYQKYIDENPEAAAKEVKDNLTPEKLLEMVGIHE